MTAVGWASTAVAVALATGCTGGSAAAPVGGTGPAPPSTSPSGTTGPVTAARAVLVPVAGSAVKGAVKFTDAGEDRVRIEVNVVSNRPGKHAVTLLDAPACPSSAGGTGGGAGLQLAVVDVDDTGTTWDTSTTDRVSLRKGERFVRARPLAVLRGDRAVACGMVLPLGRWSES